jgi:hypothetical protein
MQEFQACNGLTVVSHSTYSPVLAPCDVFLFLKLKLAQWEGDLMQQQVQATLEDS